MRAHRSGHFVIRTAGLAALVALAFLAASHASTAPGTAPHTVTSRDGTRIAFDQRGRGPTLIVVGGALSERSAGAGLARRLAPHFTVITYDRRGRGHSGDTQPYALQREIEDIEALIDHAGATAHVFGKSSGASLALQAAAALGSKVGKLALYEAPYSDTVGAAQEWRVFRAKIDELLGARRHADAVAQFMSFVGAPTEAVVKLKASPAWPAMVAMAPTLAYDNAVLGEDRSVPVAVAAQVQARTLVMDGAASLGPMPFMRQTADTLAKHVPAAQRVVVDGQGHDVSAEALAPLLLKFFAR